jgi:hypothetical protein
MAHASWGSGFPNCQTNKIKGVVRADGLKLQLREELITLFSLLIDQTERMGYEVRRFNAAGQVVTGGFSCRGIKILGVETNEPSNHSWGMAIDINSDVNPQKHPLTTNIPVGVREVWTRFGFRWGGTFSTPDPMHFEYMGSVTDAPTDTARAQRELASRTRRTIMPLVVDDRDGPGIFVIDGGVKIQLTDSAEVTSTLEALGQPKAAVWSKTTLARIPNAK